MDRSDPFSFVLGWSEVIAGWSLGLAQMKVSDQVNRTIPSDLAYGREGYPGAIPPNAKMVFEVEWLAMQ